MASPESKVVARGVATAASSNKKGGKDVVFTDGIISVFADGTIVGIDAPSPLHAASSSFSPRGGVSGDGSDGKLDSGVAERALAADVASGLAHECVTAPGALPRKVCVQGEMVLLERALGTSCFGNVWRGRLGSGRSVSVTDGVVDGDTVAAAVNRSAGCVAALLSDRAHVVMEHGVPLSDVLVQYHDGRALPLVVAVKWAREIALALASLAELRCASGDGGTAAQFSLRPHNVVLVCDAAQCNDGWGCKMDAAGASHFSCKLLDLQPPVATSSPSLHNAVQKRFTAPEVAKDATRGHTPEAMVWSFGALLQDLSWAAQGDRQLSFWPTEWLKRLFEDTQAAKPSQRPALEALVKRLVDGCKSLEPDAGPQVVAAAVAQSGRALADVAMQEIVAKERARSAALRLGRFGTNKKLEPGVMAWPRIVSVDASKKEGESRKLDDAWICEDDFRVMVRERLLIRIVGQCGHGKSSLCKWFAWCWARSRKWPAAEPLVVYVPLGIAMKRLRGHRLSLADLLHQYWSWPGLAPELRHDVPLALVENFVRTSDAFYVFDGVDEGMAQADDAGRAWLQQEVLTGRLECRGILSGRSDGSRSAFPGRELELKGICDASVRKQAILDYFDGDMDKTNRVLDVLEDRAIAGLCRSHLALQLICSLYSMEATAPPPSRAPQTLTKLYAFTVLDVMAKQEAAPETRERLDAMQLDFGDGVKAALKGVDADVSRLILMSGLLKETPVYTDWDSLSDDMEFYHWSFAEFFGAMHLSRQFRNESKRETVPDSEDIRRAVGDCRYVSLMTWRFVLGLLLPQDAEAVHQAVWTSMFVALAGLDYDQLRRHFQMPELSAWSRRDFVDVKDPAVLAAVFLTRAKVQFALTSPNDAALVYDAALVALPKDAPVELAVDLHRFAGWCLHVIGKTARAVQLLEQARKLQETRGTESEVYARVLTDHATLLCVKGDLKGALTLFERALGIQGRVTGTKNHSYAASLHQIASVYYDQGNWKDAIAVFQQALATKRLCVGTENESYAATLHCIATVHRAQGNLRDALRLFETALDLMVSECVNWLCLCFFVTRPLRVAVWARRTSRTPRRWATLPLYIVIRCGGVCASCSRDLTDGAAQGNLKDALAMFSRSLEVKGRCIGTDNESYAATLHEIARVHHTQVRLARAFTYPRVEVVALQENLNDAATMYLTSYHILKNSVGTRNTTFQTCVKNISSMLTKTKVTQLCSARVCDCSCARVCLFACACVLRAR